MKKFKSLVIFSLLLILLSSCTDSNIDDIKSYVESPKSNIVSIEGSWKVVKKNSVDDTKTEEINKIDEIHIDKDLVQIGSRYNLYPKFESEYVNASNYFKQKELPMEVSNITDDELIEVILISGTPRFTFDIVKISEDKLFMVTDGYEYHLERETDKVDESILSEYEDERKSEDSLESYDGKIGLSLIVKNQNKSQDSDIVNTYYDSYYIHYDNTNYKRKGRVYVTDNIYLPRDSTNDVFKYTEDWDGEDYKGSFVRLNVRSKNNSTIERTIYQSVEPFELTYMSDQYYSIAFNDSTTTSRKLYRIYELDGMSTNGPRNVIDLDNKNGKKIIEDKINSVREKDSLNLEKNAPIENYVNIGIVRLDGLWKFRTSLVLGEDNITIKEVNFDLNVKDDFFRNNTLGKYKWSEIKEKYPDVIDAYTSPENNFILVNGEENISLYNVTDMQNPIITLPDKEGLNSIIMADWIVGNDADLFREEFRKDNGTNFKIY